MELVENAGVGSGWLRLACDAIADSSGRGHEISEGEDRDQCHAPRWMVRVAKKIFCPERESRGIRPDSIKQAVGSRAGGSADCGKHNGLK